MSALLQQAITHLEKGELSAAEAIATAALDKDASNGDALHIRGVIALHAQQPHEAIKYIDRARQILPDDALLLANLAAAYTSAGLESEAEHTARRAIEINPAMPEAHYQMALSHMARTDVKAAFDSMSEAIRLRPTWTSALNMAGHFAFHAGQFDAAGAYARRALALDKTCATSWRVLADLDARFLRYDDALKRYQKALSLAPDDETIHGNYGILLSRMGRETEAMEQYEEALSRRPTLLNAREGLGFSLMAAGRLEEGWLIYGTRLKNLGSTFATRDGPPQLTSRSQLAGKKVIGWLDQGVGDQIMFASLIPDLINAGANLTVECEARLIPVIKKSFPTVSARPTAKFTPQPGDDQFDYQVYIPDTGRWFRPNFDAFPKHQGYLKADTAIRDKLRQRYHEGDDTRPVIGISWRTGTWAKVSDQKTLPLHAWGPILCGKNAIYVNLQYGAPLEEVTDAARALGVSIVYDEVVDPMSRIDVFAAQVAAMDLVITTSNATAHMAGSLNVPVWTMAPRGFGHMWHWFYDRSDSPWYPSMRLFRQREQGEWQPVIQDVSEAMAAYMAAWRP